MKTLKESILSRSSHGGDAGKRIVIENWLKLHGIRYCKINDDLTIDCDTTIEISYADFEELPDYITFNTVAEFKIKDCKNLKTLRGFPKKAKYLKIVSRHKLKKFDYTPEFVDTLLLWDCRGLTTLEGCPEKLSHFSCQGCSGIKSLNGVPKKLDGYFICNACTSLTTLEGAPIECRDFDCSYCTNLISLKGCPKTLYGHFNCSHCPKLESLDYCPARADGRFRCNDCAHKFTSDDVISRCKVRRSDWITTY